MPNNGGLNWGNIKKENYFVTSNLDSGLDYYSFVGNSNKKITSLCSMEFYGLFVGFTDKGYFVRIQPTF